jgi:choline dehydrogenase-like flavoprotein
VLPYVEAVERETPIMNYARELWLPIQTTFHVALCELGFRAVEDFNAADAWHGDVGPWPRNRRNEIRIGSLNGYLRQARGRQNLEIRDRVLVARVVMRGTRRRRRLRGRRR